MNKKIFICLLLLLNMTSIVFPWAYPLDVDLVGIKFDHGTTGGSQNIRKNYATDIDKPEYVAYYGIDENEPAAYIKSQTNRRIEACFITNWQPNLYNLQIGASVSSGNGIGDVDYAWLSLSQDPQDSTKLKGYRYFDIDGAVPSTVGKRTFHFSWDIMGVNNGSVYGPPYYLTSPIEIGTSGMHTYYTLLGTPQSPMSEPWTNVLDFACVWASGTNSESSVVGNITEGAYNTFGKNYNGNLTHAPGTTFHLTSLLGSSYADCRDMSATVHVFTKAIGGTGTQVRLIGDTESGIEDFQFKSIDPVGSPTWQTGSWNFHQVAYYSAVYDACLRLENPVRIPKSENINGNYKDDIFDPTPSWSVWVPKPSFSYTTVD